WYFTLSPTIYGDEAMLAEKTKPGPRKDAFEKYLAAMADLRAQYRIRTPQDQIDFDIKVGIPHLLTFKYEDDGKTRLLDTAAHLHFGNAARLAFWDFPENIRPDRKWSAS